ncbi:MAG: quinone oxidoreductase [Myxococcales bacterium]|jgi:NADPH2:quinone reductase|nr:quinone oxidoreductase [Myxococcales bacterium]
MRAVRVHAPGPAEALRCDEVDDPSPGPGEVVVRVEVAGVNFIDTYKRSGLYPVPLPWIVGEEGAGVVHALGEGVTGFAVGDRVAFYPSSSYADFARVPAARVIPIPDGVSARAAAAVLLQGMTAHYLAIDTFPLRPGHTALVHAAAGGTGALLVQLAKAAGARVIATVSTEEKAQVAREAGADECVLYTRDDFAAEARRLTDGRGVDVVYDGVGKATFDRSLDALALRGTMVTFGQSSGKIPPLDPLVLSNKGSLYLTRPSLHTYTHTREELLARAGDVFARVARGELRARVAAEIPLADARRAHELLESRGALGKVLLVTS